jgi:hypothetical protein
VRLSPGNSAFRTSRKSFVSVSLCRPRIPATAAAWARRGAGGGRSRVIVQLECVARRPGIIEIVVVSDYNRGTFDPDPQRPMSWAMSLVWISRRGRLEALIL